MYYQEEHSFNDFSGTAILLICLLARKKLFSYGSREMAVRVKESMITFP